MEDIAKELIESSKCFLFLIGTTPLSTGMSFLLPIAGTVDVFESLVHNSWEVTQDECS